MNKVVWITVLNKEKNEIPAKRIYGTVGAYGLTPAGHFWRDDLEKMAWSAAREDLVKKETGLWIVVGTADDFLNESFRYGLSLLALGVQTQKGHGFPILIAVTAGRLLPANLPTTFGGAEIVPVDSPSLGAKIAARANLPIKKSSAGYRLDIFAVQGLGQWFEVGPAEGHAWAGAMFGVAGAEINSHGVGTAQKLPERSVLEYAMKGLKIQLGETEYTAWAVQNRLGDNDSYYLRVGGYPSAILFGPLSQEEEAEAYVVRLK